MSAFAKAVQDGYAARTVRTVTVPEWDGMTLYVSPVTILQLQKIMAETDSFRRAARIVQVRGKREDGQSAFDEDDFNALCAYGVGKYGPDVIARVAAEIMADVPTSEETAKN